MRFKKFVQEYDSIKRNNSKTPEELFEDVVGVGIPNLESFIAWLTLNEYIKPYIKKKGKPIPLSKLSENQKMLYLTKKLPKIKELANEFSNKFGDSDYLLD
jgi:hypothetical protein